MRKTGRTEEADLVIHNATNHSMDEANTTHQAMAVRDGKIIELGAERQIMNRYAAKEIYDAKGRSVYPGFIDGHCHFFGYGLNKTEDRPTGCEELGRGHRTHDPFRQSAFKQ